MLIYIVLLLANFYKCICIQKLDNLKKFFIKTFFKSSGYTFTRFRELSTISRSVKVSECWKNPKKGLDFPLTERISGCHRRDEKNLTLKRRGCCLRFHCYIGTDETADVVSKSVSIVPSAFFMIRGISSQVFSLLFDA